MLNSIIPEHDPNNIHLGWKERQAKELSTAFPKIEYDEALSKINSIPETTKMGEALCRIMMWAAGLQLQRTISR